MKELAEVFAALVVIAVLVVGAIGLVLLFYGGVLGTLFGVIYLFIKGVVGLFT